MSTNTPNPSRFEVYTEVKDGSGFKIKGSDFIFKFDRYKGWFDEYSNYYNASGTPEDPPSGSERSDEEYYRDDHSNHSYHSEDEFEK